MDAVLAEAAREAGDAQPTAEDDDVDFVVPKGKDGFNTMGLCRNEKYS